MRHNFKILLGIGINKFRTFVVILRSLCKLKLGICRRVDKEQKLKIISGKIKIGLKKIQ